MVNAKWTCPDCGNSATTDAIGSGGRFDCDCGFTQQPHSESICNGRIEFCPLCKTPDLYVQKDFPERVGIAIVVVGCVLATVAWAYYSPLATFGVLFLFFAIDAALFYTRKDVTVCYRCLIQLRGMADNPDHRAFDLGIGEKYRQERLRIDERRRQGHPAAREITPPQAPVSPAPVPVRRQSGD